MQALQSQGLGAQRSGAQRPPYAANPGSLEFTIKPLAERLVLVTASRAQDGHRSRLKFRSCLRMQAATSETNAAETAV